MQETSDLPGLQTGPRLLTDWQRKLPADDRLLLTSDSPFLHSLILLIQIARLHNRIQRRSFFPARLVFPFTHFFLLCALKPRRHSIARVQQQNFLGPKDTNLSDFGFDVVFGDPNCEALHALSVVDSGRHRF